MGESDVATPPERLIRQPADAEYAVRDWLRYWGQIDAIRIGGSGDMGVDVESSAYIVQVKATTGAVGRPVVQQTFGEATHRSKNALVFSLGGFTDEALEWAAEAGVGLFEFDLQGTPLPLNHAGAELAASRPDSGTQARRVLVGEVADVDHLLRESPSVDEHVLVLGDGEFIDGVTQELAPVPDDNNPAQSMSLDRRFLVWRYDSRIHHQPGEFAAVLSNLQPGGSLVIRCIEALPPDMAEMLQIAVGERVLDFVLGKGPTAQVIRVDLPVFRLVGVSSEPGQMPRDLLRIFDRWLIQQVG